jgi:hypothetical protein
MRSWIDVLCFFIFILFVFWNCTFTYVLMSRTETVLNIEGVEYG